MTALPKIPGLRRGPTPGPAVLALLFGSAGLVVLAAAMVEGLDQSALSAPKVFIAGLGLVCFCALALARYDTAVVVSVALTAVVVIEPAPCDAAFSVLMAIAAVTGRFRLSRAPRSAMLFVSALLAINVLSIMDSVSISTAFRFFFITAYLMAFSIWMCGYLDRPERVRAVVIAYLVVGVGSALLGVLAFNLPIPMRAQFLGDGGSRAQALFKDPNVYGPFLVPIAVILLDQQVRPRLLRLRPMVGMALFGILALGILFSFSRAAWANLAMATAIMLVGSAITRRGGGRAMRVLVGLVVIGAVVAAILGATGSVGFLQHRAQIQSYDTQRFAAQHAGYELGWSHPVGVGPGQFQFHHNIESHSTYVRVLAEQGFGGLLAWLAILSTTLVLALRNVVRGRDTYGIGPAALLGCWCGLIFNSAVVDTLHWRHLWLVAAMIWAGAMREARIPGLTTGAGAAARRRDTVR
ncbi:O-antigen ligase family protein [Conexibacter woesei]|uniref:O-antigen ligase family protein n=1 Tax=Conexibacter woesei TaxID=191495 RepID=UPI00041992E6|nr:O-antigen ligase family protein [Conexibacter woesei]